MASTTEMVITVLNQEMDRANAETNLESLQNKAVNLKNGILNGFFAGFENAACEILDTYRSRYQTLKTEKAEIAASLPPVADGTYTVELPDGKYYTVEIEVAKKGALAGKRIASYLNGPDNDSHFKGFGFVTEHGDVAVWKSAKADIPTAKLWGYTEAVKTVMGYPELASDFREAYAMKSGRCSKCHKTLTVPASLHRGIGPECAKAYA
jgi:uncharacterized protein DUF6011